MSGTADLSGTSRPAGGNLRTIQLHLGIDSSGRPIGSLQAEGKAPSEFVGWVALMSDLGALLPTANPPT